MELCSLVPYMLDLVYSEAWSPIPIHGAGQRWCRAHHMGAGAGNAGPQGPDSSIRDCVQHKVQSWIWGPYPGAQGLIQAADQPHASHLICRAKKIEHHCTTIPKCSAKHWFIFTASIMVMGYYCSQFTNRKLRYRVIILNIHCFEDLICNARDLIFPEYFA